MEYVYGKKYDTNDQEVKYLVKWSGFKKSESTWEPLDHLFSVKTTVQEYNLIQSRHLFYERYLNKPLANFVKHGISPAKDDKEGFELLEERKRNQEEKGEKRQKKQKKKGKNEESKSESKENIKRKENSPFSGENNTSENDGKSEKIKTRRSRETNNKKNNSKEVFIREKNLQEMEKNNIDIIEVRDRQRKSANREEKTGEEADINNNNNNKKYFGDFRKNLPLIVSKHREKEGQKKDALLDQVYYKIDWQIDEEGVRPKSGYFSLDDLKLYCPLLLIEYLEKKGRLVNDESKEI